MSFALAPDGARIAYQTSGEGAPLLLLAGQANSHHWWNGVRADFAPYRTTITLDYRGTGDSDAPDEHYSTRGFARDTIEVLDELGIDRADVYGTSMGGRVAQWVAADHPRRVRSLVLGCTSPGGTHGLERDAEVRAKLADPAVSRQFLLELMYSPAWLADHPGPYWTLGDPHMSARSRKLHFRASAEHDAWDALPRIAAPTLILHGDADRFNPSANAPLLASRIPRCRVELIPGARHAYFEERRDVASPSVVNFLAS
ncbi:alpha/beta fold hydrolase [Pseudonocardia spinosispora]|uniref:alpha/beta fold hydrolase n=1 Tax=Pseudonocardia spinosispora TaxID=103441 RepID=UPI00041BEE9F|nr:alpha/beta fold hydrolase [Pseudonocardia spinosispora]